LHDYIWGSGDIAPPFLTSVLCRDEWSVWHPSCITPEEEFSGTHCVGGWLGPRDGLDSIVTIFVCDYGQGVDWWMDLITTYTHHSEVQLITAPLLISTIHKLPQHMLSIFPACCVLASRSLATAYSNGDSSTCRAQVLLSQPPVQNSCQLSTQLYRHHFSASLAELNWTANPQLNLIAPVVFSITLQRGLHRKHCPIVVCVFVSAGRVYRAVAQKRPFFISLLHSNGCNRCLFWGLCLATGLYATLWKGETLSHL
jgi:hypothetical protein